jgi:hypothetical protein
MTSATIPSSITSIGEYAFEGCTGLESIRVYKTAPINIASGSTFDLVNKTTCILHVPVGSKALYQAAAQWQDFANIVEDLPTAVVNTTTNKINIFVHNKLLSIESKALAINSVKLITTGGNTLYEDTAVKGNIYNKQINYTGILLCVVSLENGETVTEKITTH